MANRRILSWVYDSLEEYRRGSHYFGCIVGRYANRIAGGKFTLKGKQYTLVKNEGDNHLHGGNRGYDKVVWQSERPVDGCATALILKYFSQPTGIGARIEQDDPQLILAKGYDHNWVLNKEAGQLSLAARVMESTSGRTMEVYTIEPGIQFYTGNFLDDRIAGKDGQIYRHRGGFCLETQHFPDAPNRPEFPSVVLEPAAKYQSTTFYRFSNGSA